MEWPAASYKYFRESLSSFRLRSGRQSIQCKHDSVTRVIASTVTPDQHYNFANIVYCVLAFVRLERDNCTTCNASHESFGSDTVARGLTMHPHWQLYRHVILSAPDWFLIVSASTSQRSAYSGLSAEESSYSSSSGSNSASYGSRFWTN